MSSAESDPADPVPTDRDPDPYICPLETMQWLIHGAKVADDPDSALKEMRRAFSAGEIELFGLRGGDGEPQKIPEIIGRNAEIDPLHRALLRIDRPYEHHPWREIFYRRADVLQLWPAAEPVEPGGTSVQADAEPDPYRTGAPGRPTIMHLIRQEFDRRAAAGEVLLSSIADEAKALHTWAAEAHSSARTPTVKTIRNSLSEPYRRHRQDGARN